MEDEELLALGFKPLSYFTIGDVLIYRLSRNRHLSLRSRRTPNEMLFLCETDESDPQKITDLICISNWDYNGPLDISTLKTLIQILERKK
jgi:hypothetical protein